MKIIFPIEIWRHIYSFDLTYKNIFNQCIEEISKSWCIFIVDKKRFRSGIYKKYISYKQAVSECGKLILTTPHFYFWISQKNEFNRLILLENKSKHHYYKLS